LASREGVFLANNLFLTLFAFTVLLGTMLPLLVEAFAGNQVAVGWPFFDRAAIPLSFALLLAMGVGPVTPYRTARGEIVWERIRPRVVFGLALAVLVVLVEYCEFSGYPAYQWVRWGQEGGAKSKMALWNAVYNSNLNINFINHYEPPLRFRHNIAYEGLNGMRPRPRYGESGS
jgi:cytochrome c biogenesis factor